MELSKATSGLRNYLAELPFKGNYQDKTFIVPTAFGFSFAVVIVILFFLAVGYSNNLIFILVFFLISMSLVATYWTNRNLGFIKILSLQYEPSFAGVQTNLFCKVLQSNKKAESFGLNFSLKSKKKKAVHLKNLHIEGSQYLQVELPWFFLERGWQLRPQLEVWSEFPFGFLKAWRLHRESEPILVFPERKGSLKWPIETSIHATSGEVGLFKQHRDFSPLDSTRRVDWMASSRRQKILIKQFEDSRQDALDFSWSQTRHLQDFESRISQLSLWVDEAEKGGREYSLEIGRRKIERGQGPQHWQACLSVLALLSEEDFKA